MTSLQQLAAAQLAPAVVNRECPARSKRTSGNSGITLGPLTSGARPSRRCNDGSCNQCARAIPITATRHGKGSRADVSAWADPAVVLTWVMATWLGIQDIAVFVDGMRHMRTQPDAG